MRDRALQNQSQRQRAGETPALRTATSKTPASKAKAGGRYKFKRNVKGNVESNVEGDCDVDGNGWRSEDRRYNIKC